MSLAQPTHTSNVIDLTIDTPPQAGTSAGKASAAALSVSNLNAPVAKVEAPRPSKAQRVGQQGPTKTSALFDYIFRWGFT